MDVLKMKKDEILRLEPYDDNEVNRLLTREEILHIFREFGGLWIFNRDTAKEGKVPKRHALLKSGRHSDGFLNSKAVLNHPEMVKLFAFQMLLKWHELIIREKSLKSAPYYIAGIPDGATALGLEFSRILGANIPTLIKIDKEIKIASDLERKKTLLLVEDFCTKGTGFIQDVIDIKSKYPKVKILPYEFVIINRGGLEDIYVDGVGTFKIEPIATHRIRDWRADECPLCDLGSKAVKPKESPEIWAEFLAESA